MVDDRALKHCAARQLVQRRGQGAEHEPQHLDVGVQPLRLLVGLQLEPALEPSDVGVLGQVLQQLRVKQPRGAGERRVALVGKMASSDAATACGVIGPDSGMCRPMVAPPRWYCSRPSS
jgi:hypothetical protein